MSETICVAGASGMTGRAIIEELEAWEGEVRATYFSQLPSDLPQRPGLRWIAADLRRRKDCLQVLEGCSCAIHVAAITGGSVASQKNPWDQVTDNLVMGAEFLHACHEAAVKRVILVGSATCYAPSLVPHREVDLDLNQDPYAAHFGIGWVTRSLEKLGAFWHHKTGLEIIHVRAANIFGPYAPFDPGRANFIPALISKAAQQQDPFQVFGEPGVVRDVIFSKDFARYIVALLQTKNWGYAIINLGSGRETTVDQVVQWCLLHSGHRPSHVEYTGISAPATRYRVLDCEKLLQVVGQVDLIGIEKGIALTTGWFKENQSLWKR
jgi:GDP-L-fucose synthase